MNIFFKLAHQTDWWEFVLNISEQLDSQPQQRFIKRPQVEVRFYLNPSIAYPLWKKKTDADACERQVNKQCPETCLSTVNLWHNPIRFTHCAFKEGLCRRCALRMRVADLTWIFTSLTELWTISTVHLKESQKCRRTKHEQNTEMRRGGGLIRCKVNNWKHKPCLINADLLCIWCH